MSEPKFPPCKAEDVAPLRNREPDLLHHMPTRFVPLEEAEFRGWSFFYVGETCSYGHMAPRRVSNPRACIDCYNVRHGKKTIGGKGQAEYVKEYVGPDKKKKEKAPAPYKTKSQRVLTEVTHAEPDELGKWFLTEYAKTRSFRRAAEACGAHEAEFLGRLSYDHIFRQAVHKLEQDQQLAHTPAITDDFDWTDDKRITLIRVYVNTGSLISAMNSVGVSHFQYLEELKDNAEFAAGMEEAEKAAHSMLEHYGINRAAIGGEVKLLQDALKAHNDKYSAKVKVDMNSTVKLSSDQLVEAILGDLIGLKDGRIIEGVFETVEPRAAIEAPREDQGAEEARESAADMDFI